MTPVQLRNNPVNWFLETQPLEGWSITLHSATLLRREKKHPPTRSWVWPQESYASTGTWGGSGRGQREGAVSAFWSRHHVMSLTAQPHCHKWLQDICIILPHPVHTNPRNQELKWIFAPLSVTCFVTGTSRWWTALIFLSLLGLRDGLLWPSLLQPPTTPKKLLLSRCIDFLTPLLFSATVLSQVLSRATVPLVVAWNLLTDLINSWRTATDL